VQIPAAAEPPRQHASQLLLPPTPPTPRAGRHAHTRVTRERGATKRVCLLSLLHTAHTHSMHAGPALAVPPPACAIHAPGAFMKGVSLRPAVPGPSRTSAVMARGPDRSVVDTSAAPKAGRAHDHLSMSITLVGEPLSRLRGREGLPILRHSSSLMRFCSAASSTGLPASLRDATRSCIFACSFAWVI